MNFDSTAAIGQGGATTISAVQSDIIQTHVFSRLDGPTLAAAGCASSQLHSLSTDDHLWRSICNQTWPSTADPLVHCLISTFPSGHRSFYSDSFPTLHHRRRSPPNHNSLPPTPGLISAVDLRYQNRLILSKVQKTETVTGWFLSSPFRVDLVDPKETLPSPVKFQGGDDKLLSDLEDNMALSWILIDPTRKRSGNFSSLKPVSVNRHWLTGDIQVRYAKILAGDRRGEFFQCAVVVTCGGKEKWELQLREVNLQVEDMEGKSLSGKDSLVVLQEAMESGKRRKGKRGEGREMYAEYLLMKKEMGERKQRRENMLDMACIATGIIIFLAWTFVLMRRYT
ncbi:hypothetical protein U1Q18_032630 [Sarracenia purpurea var. burkii]